MTKIKRVLATLVTIASIASFAGCNRSPSVGYNQNNYPYDYNYDYGNGYDYGYDNDYDYDYGYDDGYYDGYNEANMPIYDGSTSPCIAGSTDMSIAISDFKAVFVFDFSGTSDGEDWCEVDVPNGAAYDEDQMFTSVYTAFDKYGDDDYHACIEGGVAFANYLSSICKGSASTANTVGGFWDITGRTPSSDVSKAAERISKAAKNCGINILVIVTNDRNGLSPAQYAQSYYSMEDFRTLAD